jgi:hypothetical protein
MAFRTPPNVGSGHDDESRWSNVMEYSAALAGHELVLAKAGGVSTGAVFNFAMGHCGYKSDHLTSIGCNLTHTHQSCPLVIRK